jgi:hypothetical protein
VTEISNITMKVRRKSLYRAIGLVLDSIHRLVCGRQNTATFRRLHLSPSSGGWSRINLLSWARYKELSPSSGGLGRINLLIWAR